MKGLKQALETVCVAFSLYSRLPVPQVAWTAANMRFALCALPLVGAAAGLAMFVWNAAALWLGLGNSLRAAGLVLAPVLVAGGIHLDGFCDTCDALASHADTPKKLEIMKDPHAGAFALIGLACYFTFYFGLACQWAPDGKQIGLMTLCMALERALAGLAMCRLPCAKNSGLAHAFADAAAKKQTTVFLGVLSLALAGGLVWLGGRAGLLALAAALLCLAYYRRLALKQFGGVTGDLQGYFVQLCEICCLSALVLSDLLW